MSDARCRDAARTERAAGGPVAPTAGAERGFGVRREPRLTTPQANERGARLAQHQLGAGTVTRRDPADA